MKGREKANPEFSVTVKRAYEFDNGNVSFDAEVNGVMIYGMTLIWQENKKTYFVAFPSRKGSDGKYYKYVYFPVDDKLQIEIMEQVDKITG